MLPLQQLELTHIPTPHTIHIALFNDLHNGAYLRSQLLAQNTDFEYAFIDASAIVSTTHILAAVHNALHALLLRHSLRTRNIHSEIILSLSPNNNITESYKRFGVSSATTQLICVRVSTGSNLAATEAVREHLESVVEGTGVEFRDAELRPDWAKVGRLYKLAGDLGARRSRTEKEVLGKMVLRSVA